ncbi:pantetheine-phosphate adenylyltransferase [Halobacteroides halobius DSM 5150]|uniref:Phosphopantetheine adenylyltransferase n=1 Tax=Halobacteroides halobius (strain ATCC 35273 / DSM 5150 / MD-1) TaxID=748449 RepID=L0K796_HALHC|nr:pantetheine-phosphate adenylyltransferase [Halobacteroides halobius]AGB41157.1 pantetheine-phosphate adenylyltransferase [Halobacteroides halobius DSM 5150]
MAKVAVYPGSFDPVTTGHLDIIRRTSNIFDEVIVAVFVNPNKNPLFTREERVEMLEEVLKDFNNVMVDDFAGLLTEYLKEQDGDVIVRGLRAVSDFESEFQMASMNKKLAPEIETLFMMTNTKYAYLSSSAVKEVASFGGCIEELVPEYVIDKLIKRLKKEDKMVTEEDRN